MCDLSMFCFSNEAARVLNKSVPTLHYYVRTNRLQANRMGPCECSTDAKSSGLRRN